MAEFLSDPSKCINCGICTTVCPSRILYMKDSEIPSMREGMETACIRCGQCTAVCPNGAAELIYEGAGAIPKVSGSLKHNITPDDFAKLILTRRSVRKFKQEQVDRKLLERILDIVRYAPTGVNSQDVSWVVLTGANVPALVKVIAECGRKFADEHKDDPFSAVWNNLCTMYENGIDRIANDAPLILVACTDESAMLGEVDSIIAMSYFELTAVVNGLGTCWGGFCQIAASLFPEVRKAACIPEGKVPRYFMLAGYPDIEYTGVPKRDALKVFWK